MGLFIKIINDGTGDKLTGHYDYKVYINQIPIGEGRIENFNRPDGWRTLVQQLAEDVQEKPALKWKELGYDAGEPWGKAKG